MSARAEWEKPMNELWTTERHSNETFLWMMPLLKLFEVHNNVKIFWGPKSLLNGY